MVLQGMRVPRRREKKRNERRNKLVAHLESDMVVTAGNSVAVLQRSV